MDVKLRHRCHKHSMAAAQADVKSVIVPAAIEGKVMALQALEQLESKLNLECMGSQGLGPVEMDRCREKRQVVYELTLPLITDLAEYQNSLQVDYLMINKVRRDFIAQDIMSQTFGTPSLLEQYRAGSRSANAIREYEGLPEALKFKYQVYLKTPASAIAPPGGLFTVASKGGGAGPWTWKGGPWRWPRRGGRGRSN